MILSGACGGLQLTVSLAYRKVYYSLHAGSKNSLDPSVTSSFWRNADCRFFSSRTEPDNGQMGKEWPLEA